jgi:putative DNA primase/helicase
VAEFFSQQGRALLGNGFPIIPIRPGEKRPAISGWQNSQIGAGDLHKFPSHGVGVLTGQGAWPIVALDIDCYDAAVTDAFVEWCRQNLGPTSERIGQAPKRLLVYRAAAAGWRPINSAAFEDCLGLQHRLQILGRGQQFVAHAIHPDTGKPYAWLSGDLTDVRARDLAVLTEDQVRAAVTHFELLCESVGWDKRAPSVAPQAPATRSPRADIDFFGRVNDAAMQAFDAWVPALFPAARAYGQGYRVASVDLGRDLEEDLSIVPSGIKDFGVADLGDARAGGRTPIDLVIEWAGRSGIWDDVLEAPARPFEAAQWLCSMMDAKPESLGLGLRAVKERESVLTALAAWKVRLESVDNAIELLDTVAAGGRELIAATPALKGQVHGLLRERYREVAGVPLLAAELNRVLRPLRGAVARARERTQFGMAERMIDAFGEGLAYVPEFDSWFIWSGTVWRRAAAVEIQHLAKETIRALEAEMPSDDAERVEFFKWALSCQQAYMVESMIKLAASDPRVMVPADQLDRQSRYLGAPNGVIDLWTGDLLDPDPELLITMSVGCDYRPGVAAPVWQETVAGIFADDPDMPSFVQRLIGYAALGDPSEDVIAIPYGSGANGKSTLLNTIRRALGGYARTAAAETFVTDGGGSSNAGGPREDLLRLKGARFVYVAEPGEGSELRESAVKAMTGGDALIARGLHARASVEFVPTWLAVMPTNHKPIIKGDDHGIWRRIVPIPFLQQFSGASQDTNREAKLSAEMSGILTWIVQGALEYRRSGLAIPGSVSEARKSYRESMDLLAEWLEQCCDIGPNRREKVSALWTSWEMFARARGNLRYISSAIALSRRLESRFPPYKDGDGQRWRWGLTLKTETIGDGGNGGFLKVVPK